jgi:WD40 repeat protein
LAAIKPDEQGIRLFDIRTGSLIHDLNRPGRRVASVLASSASARLLTIESVPDHARRPPQARERTPGPAAFEGEVQVILWDLSRIDEPVAVLEKIRFDRERRGYLPVTAAFSPEGMTVAVATTSNSTATVTFYSAENGQATHKLDTQAELLTSLALGANNVMATASGSTIQLWDREAGTFLSSLTSSRGMPWIMRFNAKGTLLATASGKDVEVWDTASHRILAVLSAADWVTDLSFTPDGRTLAVGGGRTTTSTTVWKVSDPTARVQLGGFEGQTLPSSLAFSPDGCLAIGMTNGDVRFYREGGNRCTASSPTSTTSAESAKANLERDRERDRTRRVSLIFDAAGRLIAHDGSGLRIWQPGPGIFQPSTLVRLPLTSPVPWGTWLARAADAKPLVLVRAFEVALWQADHPHRLRQVVPPPPPSGREPNALFPPGSRAASGTESWTARGPRTDRDRERSRGAGAGRFGRDIFAIQLAPKADRIYLVAENRKLNVWALEPRGEDGPIDARRIDIRTPVPDEIFSLALRPDGALLALGDSIGNVTLLDTTRLRVVGRILAPGEEVKGIVVAMAFSPDGRRLAVGSQQGQISLWSLDDPGLPILQYRLPGQRGLVTNLVFDRTGRRLASTAGIEPLVEIWSLGLIERELQRLGLAD